MPAVGSKELDILIDAYLPGPASPSEKRTTVALDFFEYSARTGENFKYFAVTNVTAANSPIGVTPSPVMSELTYASSSQASTPATPATTKSSSRSAKRPETTDFSHLPGMRIITVDGQDVTNHVSRGCKTKEQRDHAHLMRILKACDACKKKKIRCDPSHKKRSVSQTDSAKSEFMKPAKKSKKASASAATPKSQSTAFTPAPDIDYQPEMSNSLEEFTTSMVDWDQYFTFNEPIENTLPQDFYNAVPNDFNFFFEPEAQFSPTTSGSSAVSPAQPLTPIGSGMILPQTDFTFDDSSFTTFAPADTQEAILPYLASGAHGSNYVDFNLYSPAASFIDEEPKKLKAGEKRKATASPVADLNKSLSSSGVFNDHQSGFDQSPSVSLTPMVPAWDINGGQYAPGGELGGGYTSDGLRLPFHNDDSSHGTVREAPNEALLHGLQSPTVSGLAVGRNSGALLQGRSSLSSTSVVASASMVQQGVSPSTGSEGRLRPTEGSTQLVLNSPLTVQSPVRNLHPLVPLEVFKLTFEKAPQVLGTTLPAPRPHVPMILSDLPSPVLPASPSTAILSNSPGRQGQCVPAGGLASFDQQLRATAGQQSPQLLSVQPLPIVATGILHTTATAATATATVSAAGLAHGNDSSAPLQKQQQTADCMTAADLQPCPQTTGPSSGGVSQQGLLSTQGIRSSLAQLSEILRGSVVRKPLTTPVRQLLVASTASVLQTYQLAVFGLVSLLLIIGVAVTSISDLQQQLQQQGQYPIAIAPSIPSLLPTMMIFLFLLSKTPSNRQQKVNSQAFFGKRAAITLLDSVRSSLLGGLSSSSAAAPSRRQQTNRSSSMTTAVPATQRVMVACF